MGTKEMERTPDVSRDTVTEANREAWDKAAGYHRDHEQFRRLLEGFGKPGHNQLDDILTERLQDQGLAGKSVIQLCCNNGREILSVKNLGAARCVGVDQSAPFLAQGAELAAAGGIACEFVCCNVYDLPQDLNGQFDLVLITIGVFGWMPDLGAFFNAVARVLKPGGRFLVYEDHPILNMFDDSAQDPGRLVYSYFDKGPWREAFSLDYYGGREYEAPDNYWICHSLSDIFMGLIGRGFAIEVFEEFEHNVGCWQKFESVAEQLPLSYYLRARC